MNLVRAIEQTLVRHSPYAARHRASMFWPYAKRFGVSSLCVLLASATPLAGIPALQNSSHTQDTPPSAVAYEGPDDDPSPVPTTEPIPTATPTQTPSTGPAAPATTPADLPPVTPNWSVPVRMESCFQPNGSREYGVYGGRDHIHRGIDLGPVIGVDYGEPIYAIHAGTAHHGYEADGAGTYVWVDHGDGTSSWYFHMDSRAVGDGVSVRIGQPIGYVGSSGNSTATHLHFGIKVSGNWTDPIPFMRDRGVIMQCGDGPVSTPVPTTPAPEQTPTAPAPSQTPEPTPTPSPTPEPSESPSATPTDPPSATPEPSASPTESLAPDPTATPEPSPSE